jgi:hypothetical protein
MRRDMHAELTMSDDGEPHQRHIDRVLDWSMRTTLSRFFAYDEKCLRSRT